MTGTLHYNPMGEGVPPKVVPPTKGKGGEEAEQLGPSVLPHPGAFMTAITSQCFVLSAGSLHGPPFAWFGPKYVQENDDVTELRFQKAEWPSAPTFFRAWGAVN